MIETSIQLIKRDEKRSNNKLFYFLRTNKSSTMWISKKLPRSDKQNCVIVCAQNIM